MVRERDQRGNYIRALRPSLNKDDKTQSDQEFASGGKGKGVNPLQLTHLAW